MPAVRARNLPRHVGIIMDGNGRWAQLHGMERPSGHRQGSEAVRRTVRAARRLGLHALTLYAFSEQNWSRPPTEVGALMDLLVEFLRSEHDELMSRGIRLRSVGRVSRLPSYVKDALAGVERDTSGNRGMVLTLALSYGGREEIADAARVLASKACAGLIRADAIDEQMLAEHIPSRDVGDLDLLVRTGGELRISNFLLWAAAYAELFFTDRLWPEFGADDLYEAIAAYQQRDRRFGRVSSRADADYAEPAGPG